MKTKAMSYKKFQKLAMKNYAKGGRCVVEWWNEMIFHVHCAEFGPMTKEKALDLFHLYSSCGMA